MLKTKNEKDTKYFPYEQNNNNNNKYSCKRLTVCKMGVIKHLFRNEGYVEALRFPFLFTVSIPKHKMCLINYHFEVMVIQKPK